MTKAFTKGQKVTVIGDWNGKGTCYVRQATVHSCGTKQLKLTCDSTGDEFGRNLRPVVAEAGQPGVRPRLEGAALEAEAMSVAVTVLESERARLTHCRDKVGPTAGYGYTEAMQRGLDALKTPVWGHYCDLSAAVYAAVRGA